MESPEYYVYGPTRSTTKFEIASNDSGRTTSSWEDFEKIKNLIGNVDYSCLHYGPDAEKGGCFELQYAKELQKVDHGFVDT
jgi:hypothetical protein